MKEKLNDLATLLLFVAAFGAIVLLMGMAFELTLFSVVGGIITAICGLSGVAVGLYSEEVL
jgi:hypothetical protein